MAAVALDLEALRKSLIRQEDTIIFSLIERAKFPINSRLYDEPPPSSGDSSASSLFKFFLNESEALQAKVGRYTSPEENAFSLDNIPASLLPPLTHPPVKVLHPRAASVNINDRILDLYLKTLLPLITVEGDDGNYAATLSSDLNCLQVISRRIHFGKFVAEVKFQDTPQDYTPAICAKQDRDALEKLLTFPSVEEVVKKRIEKKATVFGQNVELYENGSSSSGTCKIDPYVVSRLYGEWVIPLTKLVEVEYLLKRLD